MELYLAMLKLIINLIFGLVVLFTSIRVFDALTRDIDEMGEIKKKNYSVGLLLGTIIVSISLMIAEVFKDSLIPSDMNEFVISTFYDLIRFMFSLIAGVIIIFIAYTVFKYLNVKRFNTVVELKNGNIAVAIVLSAYIIALSLIITPALKDMFLILISYLR